MHHFKQIADVEISAQLSDAFVEIEVGFHPLLLSQITLFTALETKDVIAESQPTVVDQLSLVED